MSRTDTIAPAEWVKKYADNLFKHAIVRVSDRETARDLVQETFLSALQNLALFRGESSEKTWLYSILKNKIIDHYRKTAGRDNLFVSREDGEPILDFYFDEEGEWKETTHPNPWERNTADDLSSKEFHDILQKCLSKLTAQCRAVFVFKYLEELEFEEICKELSITTSNYWVRMHRAKLQLRQCIEKKWIRT